MNRALLLVTLCSLLGVPLRAQDATAADPPSAWRPLRIAKWSTVTLAGAAALYGFTNNRRADQAYERIERVCVAEPQRCGNRLPGGVYSDAELEREYQRVRSLDRRARGALIGSQIGVAASVILFILDLRNQRPPDNIPYEPRRLDLGPAADGGLSLVLRLPLTLRR